MADISKISPDNGTTIYNLKDIEARKRVPEVLLKDTVGWTGKNLLNNNADSRTNNGITFTVNNDGSVTVNGTATATAFWGVQFSLPVGSYVLNGCPSGGGGNTYVIDFRTAVGGSGISGLNEDSGNGSTFTLESPLTAYLNIRIANGYTANNLTFYPMLRKADISDSTYEPYHASVEEVVGDIRAEQRVLGAKNLLPNNAASQTINGVTFTVNADGSVTANGTASADISLNIYDHAEKILQANVKYILSGCPKGGSLSTYYFGMRYLSFDYGDGTEGEFTSAQLSGAIWITVFIKSGTTVNNLVFKPMLRLASDPDNTYVPYAMTNREITEELTEQESKVTDIVSGASVGSLGNHLLKTGNVVTLDLELSGVVATANDTILFKVPQGFRPKYLIELDAVSGNVTGYLTDTGNYKVRSNISNGIIRMHGTWITS